MITANINEVSGNCAEVTLDGEGWHVVVTASVALDQEYFDYILDSWIAWTNEENINFPKNALCMPEVGVAINEALTAYYETERDETKAREAE